MTGMQRAGMGFDQMVNQAPTQIFLHIQKTAGTSLRESLTQIYEPRRVARPARYFTFVRDPLERIRSHYHQHLQAGTVFDLGNGPIDLVTVINEGLTDEFDNLQLRMIGGIRSNEAPLGTIGEPEFRKALMMMLAMFGFVGVTERLEEDWPRLLSYLGLGPWQLARSGITPARLRAAEDPNLQRIDWQRVKARHAYEIALYDYICTRPPLSPAPLAEKLPAIARTPA